MYNFSTNLGSSFSLYLFSSTLVSKKATFDFSNHLNIGPVSFTVFPCLFFLLCQDKKLFLVSVCTNRDLSYGTSCASCFHKLSWANSTHRATAQEDEMPWCHSTGWVCGRPEPCTFPSGSWTNGKGNWNVLNGHGLSRGIGPPSVLLELLSRRSNGCGGCGGVGRGVWECCCFQSCRWHISWCPKNIVQQFVLNYTNYTQLYTNYTHCV